MIAFERFKVASGDLRIAVEHRFLLPCGRRTLLYSRRQGLASLFVSAVAGSVEFEGDIRRAARVSFPLGRSNFFRGELDVRANVEYVAEAFEVKFDGLLEDICCYPGVQQLLDRPMDRLPRFAQVKLSYALGYAIGFDCLLIDGPPVIGDDAFKVACRTGLAAHRGGFLAAIDVPTAASVALADCGAVLGEDGIEMFDEVAQFQKAAGPT